MDDGFAIDVQPTVRTLSASGMVVLEVLSSDGPALVCMDLRPEMNRFNPAYLSTHRMKESRSLHALGRRGKTKQTRTYYSGTKRFAGKE